MVDSGDSSPTDNEPPLSDSGKSSDSALRLRPSILIIEFGVFAECLLLAALRWL